MGRKNHLDMRATSPVVVVPICRNASTRGRTRPTTRYKKRMACLARLAALKKLEKKASGYKKYIKKVEDTILQKDEKLKYLEMFKKLDTTIHPLPELLNIFVSNLNA